jgi:hypothetical protein
MKPKEESIKESIKLTKKLLWTIYQYNNLSGYWTDDEANESFKKDIKDLHTKIHKFNTENNVFPIDTGFYECDYKRLELLEYQNEKIDSLYNKLEICQKEKINSLHKKLYFEKKIQTCIDSEYDNYMIHYLNLDHPCKIKPCDITENDF